ncbi:methyltransferase domain-containing protein [Paenibacillus lautus]|uniref:methyltransferase domain-containing protein n=1 Tax=Paenibacillus lautus TaxID=1401 RepID=UPI0010E828E4|nr:3-demethylubiquinone-9 3-methyltransferase [Actinobacillus pleuropneumoniae]
MDKKMRPLRSQDIINSINHFLELPSLENIAIKEITEVGKGIVNEQRLELSRLREDIKLPIKEIYFLEELLQYDDEEFIRVCYHALLRRNPDSQGFNNFLALLRNGTLSKVQILGRLKKSKEAQRFNVQIIGLKKKYAYSRITNLPFFGYGLKVIASMIKLPRIVKHLQQIEAYTNARFTIRDNINDNNAEAVERLLSKQNNIIDQYRLEIHRLQSKVEILESKITNIESHNKETTLKSQVLDNRTKVLWENYVDNDNSLFDSMYLAFEDRYRGTRSNIKMRQEYYIPHVDKVFKKMSNCKLLDLGCGRGEWLELLKEKGYAAEGTDLNEDMVNYCTELGIKVEYMDILSYLFKQNTESAGVITGFHIIEHIPLNITIRVLEECMRILKPGGMIIFETPNPENIMVGSYSFFYDPTHQKPLVPDTIEFIAQQKGFINTEIHRLHKRNDPDYVNHRDIDEVLYKISMEQDYSLIAYKP